MFDDSEEAPLYLSSLGNVTMVREMTDQELRIHGLKAADTVIFVYSSDVGRFLDRLA